MSTLVTEEVAIVAADPQASSSVSWGAIAAGAVASAGLSLFLVNLGAGIGLSVVSPWSGAPSASTVSAVAGIILCLIAIMASAFGGFIAGRLRPRVGFADSNETYFRDSAHGLVAWALATILTVAVLGTVATSLVGSVARGTAANPAVADRTAYYTDMLFRSDRPQPATAVPASQASNEEIGRILTRTLVPGATIAPADRTYVAQRVAARTGLSQEEAERRVDTVVTQAKTAADEARKAAAKNAFWMAAALLCGAVAAAFAAAEGGRERDA
jgi:hypothetical protein